VAQLLVDRIKERWSGEAVLGRRCERKKARVLWSRYFYKYIEKVNNDMI
jgi:hypothetical protein